MPKVSADKEWQNLKGQEEFVGVIPTFTWAFEVLMPPIISLDEEKGYEFCREKCKELREKGFIPQWISVKAWKTGTAEMSVMKTKWFIHASNKEGSDPRKTVQNCRHIEAENDSKGP